MKKYDINQPCPHCGGDPKIANPSGVCSHIYYPDCVTTGLTPAKLDAYRQKKATCIALALRIKRRMDDPLLLHRFDTGNVGRIYDSLKRAADVLEELYNDA